MTKKINCWEYMRCGRELEGEKVSEFGICPAATNKDADGVNGGVNGGRMCWAIVGTYSFNRNDKDSFLHRNFFCFDCKFHRKVIAEEKIIRFRALKSR